MNVGLSIFFGAPFAITTSDPHSDAANPLTQPNPFNQSPPSNLKKQVVLTGHSLGTQRLCPTPPIIQPVNHTQNTQTNNPSHTCTLSRRRAWQDRLRQIRHPHRGDLRSRRLPQVCGWRVAIEMHRIGPDQIGYNRT
jgi:hypothetical protein